MFASTIESKFCKYVKKTGQKCTVLPRNGEDFCSFHRRYLVDKEKKIEYAKTALVEDPIFSEEFKSGKGIKKRSDKVRYSVWNITMNTNRPYAKMAEETKAKYKKLTEHLLGASHGLIDFITDKNSPDDPHQNIDDVRSDYRFEVSPKTGDLHLHGFMRIAHRGFLQIRMNDLRDAYNAIAGRVNIHAQAGGDSAASWQDYITKGDEALL